MRQDRRERWTRMHLLRLHGWKAIIIGWLMFWTGGPSQLEVTVGPWTRLVLGGMAFFAGVLLLSGLNREKTGYTREAVGIFAIGLWDAAMMLAVAFSMSVRGVHLYWPGQTVPLTAPRPYGAVLYLALTMMVWGVHLKAVLSDRRIGRRRNPGVNR